MMGAVTLPAAIRRHWRRTSVGELYLLVTGLGSVLMGAGLLLAPPLRTTSPALVTLYGIAGRSTWGAAFLILGLVTLAAALRPTELRFVIIMSVQVGAQTAWAVGLVAPSLTGDGEPSNILAPIAWLQLAATAIVIAASGRRPMHPPVNRGRRRTDATA